MSSRPILSRPRTRIYDSNYNIGESYYKGALDRLDRKYTGRPLSPPPRDNFAEIAERHARAFADDDLETSRPRAEGKIKGRHLFDSRGGVIAQRADDFFENGAITDETASTIQRVRASKRVALVDDVDLESTSNNLRTQRMLDRSEKILDSVGIVDGSSRRALDDDYSYKKRALKVTFDADADNLTKWSAVEDRASSSSAAASRARIDDIDEEMAAMQQKQEARERRVARLKALVAECESETVDDSGVASRL